MLDHIEDLRKLTDEDVIKIQRIFEKAIELNKWHKKDLSFRINECKQSKKGGLYFVVEQRNIT